MKLSGAKLFLEESPNEGITGLRGWRVKSGRFRESEMLPGPEEPLSIWLKMTIRCFSSRVL